MVTKGGCQGWFRQRTNLEKTLLSLSCILFLTLLLLILIGVAFHGTNSDNELEKEAECSSSECISTAGQILSKMNEQMDPCSNFYEYACGNYGQKPGETNSVAQSSVDSVYLSLKSILESDFNIGIENFDAVKSLYSSCMDFDGLHRVRKESAQILLKIMNAVGLGNWPVVDIMYEDSGIPISDRLASLAMIGVPVAFQVDVVPDSNIKGSYMLKVSPGGPREAGRSGTDIIKDDDLRTYMLFSFLLLGTPNYLRATAAVDEILSVDAYYATVDQDDSNKGCDSVELLTPDESVSKLSSLIPEMNWTSLVTMMQKEAGLQRSFAIELHCKSKIRDYLIHMKDILDKTLDNYLGWRFFESFSKHIGPAFRRRTSNREEAPPRWKECVKLLEKYAAPALARGLTLQQQKEKIEEISISVHQMATVAQTVAERVVSDIGWLSKDQKSKTLRQVTEINIHLPYVKKMNSSRQLQLLEVNKEGYTSTIISLRRQAIIRHFKNLNPSTHLQGTTEQWEFPLTSESTSTESSLEVYFDKLQEPYFRPHASDWLNMGGIGTFISREFAKVIFSAGIDSSMQHHITVWDVLSRNKSSSNCLFNMFSERFGLSKRDESFSIIKELFLDAISLEIAFESAQTGAKSWKSFLPGLKTKSDEQLFFIAYAQTFCQAYRPNIDPSDIPMKEKVNTILANSPAFEKAFSCSPSSFQTKCPIWA